MVAGRLSGIQMPILVFVLLSLSFLKAQNSVRQGDTSLAESHFERAIELKYQNSDSSIVLLQNARNDFLKNGDTLRAVEAMLELPYHYGQRVNYAKSYDILWLALLLSDNLKNDALKATIYNHIGRLYSFYKKESQAFEYLNKALEINKALVEEGTLSPASLVENYYMMCSTYRELDKPDMGKIYLDSCFLNFDAASETLEMPYLQFEKAFVLSKKNKYEEALDLMVAIEPWFEENRPSYLVLIYTYWGDIYRNLLDLRKSEDFYRRALAISDKYNSHVDFSPLVHEKLAALYIDQKDYKKAFASQKSAKNLDAQFFDSRSFANRPLLEIKDEFRLQKERQQRIIEHQRIEQLEKEEEILLLQRIILLGAFVFLLVIGWIYVKHLRSKHKTEQELIERNRELEIKKARELLELKNKELAASALQLVEKDEFLKEIKGQLKGDNGNIKTTEINRVLKTISNSNQNYWNEFKLRFTAVNEDFYTKITTQYPNLSQADQKICALIKLHFSSKEMARLLGISVESVHTTRYRLRKKMGLDRSINLENFISSL